MSGRQGYARASPAPKAREVISDADVLRLFPTAVKGPGVRAARDLVLWLKPAARGRRFFVARNDTICLELGWSPATLRRAKAAMRRAGIRVDELRDRGRGDYQGAARYVLDRRWVPALRDVQECAEVRSKVSGSKEEKTLHLVDPASPRVSEVEDAPPRGSPAPPAAAGEQPAEEVERELDAAERPAPVLCVPDGPETIGELRRRLSGLPARPLLADRRAEVRRLGRRLIVEGRSALVVTLAVAFLEHELVRVTCLEPGPARADAAGGRATIDEEVA